MRPTFAAAAFAPFGHPGSEALKTATARATGWIEAREKSEGRRACVVLPQRRHYDALNGFGEGRVSATPRSPGNLSAGPVLVYAANMEMVTLAASAASGSSIAVVDWNLRWLPGWAAVAGAINLVTSERMEPFGGKTAELLDHLDLAGNNGWQDQHGKRDAKRLLAETDLGIPTVQGAMLAYGHSARSVQDLAKLYH